VPELRIEQRLPASVLVGTSQTIRRKSSLANVLRFWRQTAHLRAATFSMKILLPHLERDQKGHQRNLLVFILLAIIFGGALVYLGILIFNTP
jgi:hypothetical protein